MKAKVTRGAGFLGALRYVYGVGDPAKQAERIGGPMAGETVAELSAEFRAARKVRPDIERPVWHCSLALPAGERLESDRWREVAERFMQRMEFSEATPWTATRHRDTDHDHIHIVASRVGMDGRVWLGQWEARRAIEAAQELEKEFGLILTPGLGDARAEVRRLSDKEINMTVRTEQVPPRLRLQQLIDAAVKDRPSAAEFAERLAVAGVEVRANLASTGRFSGFSFALDGVAFKGQQLGEAYKWAGLQKRGVTYVEASDRARLERFSAAAAARGDRVVAEPERAAPELAPGAADPAPGSGGRDSRGPGAPGADAARHADGAEDLSAARAGAARDAGGSDARDERPGSRRDGSEERAARGGPGQARTEDQEHRGIDAARGHGIPEIGGPAGGDQQRGAGAELDGGEVEGRGERAAPELDEPRVLGAPVGRSDGRGGADWAARFKRASAARRRDADAAAGAGRGDAAPAVGERNGAGARVNPADLVAARAVDPTDYLQSRGFVVRQDGRRHLSVRDRGDEVMRVTLRADGHWVACDRYENGIGDNIALVRELEPGLSFVEAVHRLHAAQLVPIERRPVAPVRRAPTLPSFNDDDIRRGREYLARRGISGETIAEAERQGLVRYTGGAVLFVGYDAAGVPWNVTRRATDPAAPVQKRDLSGTDKGKAQILRGPDQDMLFIVEGGVDALALHDMYRRRGKRPSTAIISGGSGVRAYLEDARVLELLAGSRRVVIAGENERNAEVQARTDAQRLALQERVQQLAPHAQVIVKPPPEGCKDLAEVNAREVREAREAEEARVRAALERLQLDVQPRQERRRDDDLRM